jgi:hypothetical protein
MYLLNSTILFLLESIHYGVIRPILVIKSSTWINKY